MVYYKVYNSQHMKLLSRHRSFFAEAKKTLLQAISNPSFTKLTNRSFIVVAGPDARKLLQGLTTNNIENLYSKSKQEKPKISLYTMFLNPKGKVVTDAIIFKPMVNEGGKEVPKEEQLWIDVANQTCTALYEHLRKYTWKKKVVLKNLMFEQQKPDIHAGFINFRIDFASRNEQVEALFDHAGRLVALENPNDGQIDEPVQNDELSYANFAFFDPRNAKLGVRIICGKNGFNFQGQSSVVSLDEYEKSLRLHGLSSTKVMPNKLPFMFNADLFNGFSFKKGCYLGQEIVARAYYTGIVRRRIFPFILQDQNAVIEVGQILYDENKTELGKVVESFSGFGTILCNYLPLWSKAKPIQIVSPLKGRLEIPFAQQLNAYLIDIQNKQTKLEEIDL